MKNSISARNAFCLLALLLIAFTSMPVHSANAETRSLKLYFLHTGERAEITFKRNGKYLPGGLKKINHFLRDWRRNEPTKMDPKLLDLVWEIYKEAGGRKHIHVISAYRSLKTNNLLRKRGRGVAKKSQHSLGKALDFYIPGVKLSKLRAIGLRKGLGGVGYYPKSGSPFVHMDTGRVRHWPRMSRKELVRIFPNGKTLHVPTDGKPLPGYDIAKARYEKATSGKIVVAKADDIVKKPGFFARLLGSDGDDDNADAVTAPKPVTVVKAPSPSQSVGNNISQSGFGEPDQNVIASLAPTGEVPVPRIAPRVGGTTIPDPELSIVDPVVPQTEDILQEQQIASIPVPLRAERLGLSGASLASAPAAVAAPATQVAALSATEIADLRRQVYEAVKTPVNPPAAPKQFAPPKLNIASRMAGVPRPSFGVPRPGASVPGSGVSRPTIVSNGVTGTTQTASASSGNLIGYSTTESLVNGASVIASVEKPAVETQDALKNQIKDTLTSQATPAAKPEPEQIETPATPEAAPEPAIQLASIPVPVQNPNRSILATPAIQTAAAPVPTPAPVASDAKQLSLEEIETANLNKRFSSNWTLATTARIADVAAIQPPSYDSNIQRARPNSVLSSGFSREKIRDFTQGFSGSSVEFLNFTRIE